MGVAGMCSLAKGDLQAVAMALEGVVLCPADGDGDSGLPAGALRTLFMLIGLCLISLIL